MAVSLTDAHMAPGSFTVDVNSSREILDKLSLTLPETKLGKIHLCLYEGGELVARQVTETAAPSAEGIKITAQSLSALLGKGSDGPTIVDREFVAGNNHESNPSFELFGADALDPLHWKTVALAPPAGAPEDYGNISAWNFIGFPDEGNYAAVMLYLPTDDDRIVSDDVSETKPGDVWELSARIARGAVAIPGRIRLRAVFEGLFSHPDHFAGQHSTYPDAGGYSPRGDIGEVTDTSGILGPATDHVLRVQTVSGNRITNPTFNSGLDGWTQTLGGWGTIAGPDGWVARTAGGGPAIKILTADASYYPLNYFDAVAGETWELGGWLSQEAATDGFGIITCLVSCYPPDPAKPDYYVEVARKAGDGDLAWYSYSQSFTIPDGYNLIGTSLQAHLHTAGAWLFDNIYLRRTAGNVDAYTGVPIVLASGRTYRWRLPYHADAGVTGTVQLRMICDAAGRPTKIIDGPTLSATDPEHTGIAQRIDWDFTAPSGYDVYQWQIRSEDVFGGAFWLGQGTLIDNDPTTWVGDIYGPGAPYDGAVRPYALLSGNAPTPAGATKVHTEVIAEAGAFGYTVDKVGRRRVDAGPIAATAVLTELLKDPHTGANILNPGTLHDAGNLSYDWHLRNTVLGEAIATLSATGQVNPVREWRANADRTFDWGLPEEVFTDRNEAAAKGAVILRSTQIRVRQPFEGSSTVDGVVDEVTVIGAERVAADKIKRTITAGGSLPEATTYTAFGEPLRQTRTVNDSTVDSYELAALRTSIELALAQPTYPSVTIEISDDRAWGRFATGDWIYVYDPKAELVDYDNPMQDPDTGETIWPMRLRVLDRTSSYTTGNRRLELVDPSVEEAGQGLDITDAVTWSNETVHRCTLGVRKPELLTNPAGGNALTQLRRILAQSSRV